MLRTANSWALLALVTGIVAVTWVLLNPMQTDRVSAQFQGQRAPATATGAVPAPGPDQKKVVLEQLGMV